MRRWRWRVDRHPLHHLLVSPALHSPPYPARLHKQGLLKYTRIPLRDLAQVLTKLSKIHLPIPFNTDNDKFCSVSVSFVLNIMPGSSFYRHFI